MAVVDPLETNPTSIMRETNGMDVSAMRYTRPSVPAVPGAPSAGVETNPPIPIGMTPNIQNEALSPAVASRARGRSYGGTLYPQTQGIIAGASAPPPGASLPSSYPIDAFHAWYGQLGPHQKTQFAPKPGESTGNLTATANGVTTVDNSDNTEGITQENAKQYFLSRLRSGIPDAVQAASPSAGTPAPSLTPAPEVVAPTSGAPLGTAIPSPQYAGPTPTGEPLASRLTPAVAGAPAPLPPIAPYQQRQQQAAQTAYDYQHPAPPEDPRVTAQRLKGESDQKLAQIRADAETAAAQIKAGSQPSQWAKAAGNLATSLGIVGKTAIDAFQKHLDAQMKIDPNRNPLVAAQIAKTRAEAEHLLGDQGKATEQQKAEYRAKLNVWQGQKEQFLAGQDKKDPGAAPAAPWQQTPPSAPAPGAAPAAATQTPANAPSSPAPQASAPQVVTAVDGKGNRIHWNGTAWVPLK